MLLQYRPVSSKHLEFLVLKSIHNPAFILSSATSSAMLYNVIQPWFLVTNVSKLGILFSLYNSNISSPNQSICQHKRLTYFIKRSTFFVTGIVGLLLVCLHFWIVHSIFSKQANPTAHSTFSKAIQFMI